jgi:hypothetical protein
MARINHAQQTTTNPTSKYLEWKSNDKSFSFYNKESGVKEEVKLPLKFLFLQHYHTVKGFHDTSNSGIYSNEVYYIGTEEMAVRSFKGGVIAEGLYKDIKPKIVNAGGKYHRSVYVMMEDGSIANFAFKGAVVKEWSDFIKDNQNLLDNQWVEINDSKDKKKGSVKYSVPVFTVGEAISKDTAKLADTKADELKAFLEEKSSTNKIEVVAAETVEDDLGF